VPIPRVAVVLAAGLGSRLRLGLPKSLISISDRTILQRQLQIFEEFEELRFVVGFMEMDVISAVLDERSDVVFVRNPHFFSTGPASSLALAVKDLHEPVLFLDGDTIVDMENFKSFLEAYSGDESLIGVTTAKTEQPVWVNLSQDKKSILGFENHKNTSYEWCGLAIIQNPDYVFKSHKDGPVFEMLEKILPARCFVVEAFEIDTERDLRRVESHFLENS